MKHYLDLSYTMKDCSFELDEPITEIVERYGGGREGSGSSLGLTEYNRDLDYWFKDFDQLEKCKVSLKEKFGNLIKIQKEYGGLRARMETI